MGVAPLEIGQPCRKSRTETFIFLPLIFLLGFFGMNVDLFADEPSIKWYFVAAVALVSAFNRRKKLPTALLRTSALYPGRSVSKL